jgi:Bacterial phospho-glucose isomerase C-terminal SIS domain
MFDESLLDSPEALARADTTGLLLSAAAAGARVRTAARDAAEAGITALRPDGRPRTVLIAGPGTPPGQIARLIAPLAACPVLTVPAGGAAPTPHERRWTLPGWAGPSDLLLLVTHNGTETGLIHLVEQAYRHGCTAAAVAPANSPLGDALQQARGFFLPFAPPPYRQDPGDTTQAADPGAFWALLTPVLALTDRIGLLSAPPHSIQAVADRLDAAAERFGPAADTYRNPAKTLTAELADSLPLLWSEGATTDPVARRFATLLTTRAGRPALAAALPEAVTAHAALLDGTRPANDDDELRDFFRDRVEETSTLRPRIVLLREPGTTPDRPALTVHDAAAAHGTPLSAIDAPAGTATESLAELLALTDFASVYLALATDEASPM